ncbi:MAG: MmgE/PrpD family protein [Nitrospirae bacterium]|nr:MmgE/PrpD family protein [Nitrospirota bacterium]
MYNEKEIGPVTFKVAKWATELRFKDIPKEVIEYEKMLILDGIGCSILGSTRQAGERIFNYVDEITGGKPEATIWGKGKKVPVRLAGLVNGTSAHTANMGDTHGGTIIHSNYLMPQAAIAVAEKEGKNGRDVITAIIAGNEACIRAALATHVGGAEGGYFTPEGRGWHATGSMGGIGTALATGKLLGLSVGEMVQALVLGGTQPAGIYRPSGPYMGKHLYAGKAVANGIESAYVARKGFIAGYRLFEDGLCYGTGIISPVYEMEAATRGLGEAWETLNTHLAIYPAKKIYYANLDALLHVLGTEKIEFKDIEKVRVSYAYAKAYAQDTFHKPRNATEAFNSLQYVIAAAVHDGCLWFDQLEKYNNPAILAFAKDRVEVVRDVELEKLLPAKWPGGVEVLTKDGRSFSKRFDAHIGETSNPVPKKSLEDKFRRMVAQLSRENVDTIVDMVYSIEKLDDLTKLTRLFSPNQGKTSTGRRKSKEK